MNRSLAARTKEFALRVVRLFTALPKDDVSRVVGRQLLRSGTSVGAHAREAFRARSDAELVSKLEVAIQELDESMYWMEILIEAKLMNARRLALLMTEASELMAILVTSVKTIKQRKRR
jgi:four helix bundle protein